VSFAGCSVNRPAVSVRIGGRSAPYGLSDARYSMIRHGFPVCSTTSWTTIVCGSCSRAAIHASRTSQLAGRRLDMVGSSSSCSDGYRAVQSLILRSPGDPPSLRGLRGDQAVAFSDQFVFFGHDRLRHHRISTPRARRTSSALSACTGRRPSGNACTRCSHATGGRVTRWCGGGCANSGGAAAGGEVYRAEGHSYRVLACPQRGEVRRVGGAGSPVGSGAVVGVGPVRVDHRCWPVRPADPQPH
jgi:hypothetical protein